jgi:hypothetical protein
MSSPFGVVVLEEEAITDALDGSSVFCTGDRWRTESSDSGRDDSGRLLVVRGEVFSTISVV